LATERVAEYAQTEQRLADATTVLAAPARKEQELKTRWDLVEALDRLEAALDAGVPEDEERGRMRAILVANETYRSDSILDQLGAAYLDLMSLDSSLADRRELIFDMRQSLRQQGGFLAAVRRASPLSEIVVGIIAALLGWVFAAGAGAGAAFATLIGLAAGVGAGVYVWVVLSSTNLT